MIKSPEEARCFFGICLFYTIYFKIIEQIAEFSLYLPIKCSIGSLTLLLYEETKEVVK